MWILLSFIHPHVVANMYDFSFFYGIGGGDDDDLKSFSPYNESHWCPKKNIWTTLTMD